MIQGIPNLVALGLRVSIAIKEIPFFTIADVLVLGSF